MPGQAATADVVYATAVRTGAIPLWTSRRQASLLHHNRESMRAAVRCALRAFGRRGAEEAHEAAEKLVLFTAPPEARHDLKRREQNLERFVEQMVGFLDRRLHTLHAHVAHLASASREEPRLAMLRRAEDVVVAREGVLALGNARGSDGLRASIEAVRSLALDEDEQALGTYKNIDLALELATDWLEALEQAEHNLFPQAIDYLEELELEFWSDRVGRGWLAVPADAVAQWCAENPAPEEVSTGLTWRAEDEHEL